MRVLPKLVITDSLAVALLPQDITDDANPGAATFGGDYGFHLVISASGPFYVDGKAVVANDPAPDGAVVFLWPSGTSTMTVGKLSTDNPRAIAPTGQTVTIYRCLFGVPSA